MLLIKLQKNVFSCLFLLLMAFFSKAQQKEDVWVGRYAISTHEDAEKTIDTLIISSFENAKVNDVVSKYQSDLARWQISSTSDPDESSIIRRFLADQENNEYREFGWENLNKSGKMNCIDGGHFFICQSEPETLIQFGKEESYFSKTGIFGIWLHKGLFNLKRIQN